MIRRVLGIFALLSFGGCVPLSDPVPDPPRSHQNLDTAALPDLVNDAFESNLPIIVIDTLGEAIVDEPKIPGLMRVVNAPSGPNRLSAVADAEALDIGIEHRGSSSLAFSKKQFSIEVRDEAGDERDVRLLGLSKDADWVLYGPFSDKTLMRNHIAYWLAREMNFAAPRTRFVEVFLNEENNLREADQYWGIYVLTEKNNRGKERVDIARLMPDELSGEAITGGYIVNLDRPGDGVDCIYHPVAKQKKPCFRLMYPKINKVAPEQRQWFVDYFKSFEQTLKAKGNFRRFIDVDSFVNGFLATELIKNPDGFRLSTYFTKDRNKPIALGPLWDCNLGMGNIDHPTKKRPDGWAFINVEQSKAKTLPFWWRALLEDKRFIKSVVARWRRLRREGVVSGQKITAKIDNTRKLLASSHRRNFKRWPILGVKIRFNPRPLPTTWQKEVDNLKRWFVGRVQWMDENIHNFNQR
ncbi:MAG: CotH kinase family protein [Myxococcota bacterium]|nr:CotH kinase family protein [Myxococcota bacterium]